MDQNPNTHLPKEDTFNTQTHRLGKKMDSLFLCVFLFLVSILWLIKHRQHVKQKVPPSPWKLPIIGNLHQLHDPPHHSLHSLATKHGPIMLLHFGRVPTLVVSSAKLAQEIMKTYDHVFASRPSQNLSTRVLLYGKDIAFAPYGEYWRQVRKVCVLQLLSARKVQSFRGVREEEVGLVIEKIREKSCSSSPTVDLSEMFSLLTNNVICRVALGKKYGGEESGRRFKEILREFVSLLGAIYVGDLIQSLAWVDRFKGLNARVEKNFHELDSFLDLVLEEHVRKKTINGGDAESKSETEEDLVDILLEIEKDKTLGIPFAKDSVKAIIMDMFAAGTDTTSVVLEWAMSELLKHQDIMVEAQEEVRRIAEGRPMLTEVDDIDSMHYLKSVIKETLRLHVPIPLLVPRESMETTNIQGYEIPAKTTVIINAHAIGRDPLSWQEPDKFWPKRFMSGGGASSIDVKGLDFELIPFGAGRRGCPGATFSMVLIQLALANLLNKFDWGLPGGMEGKDLDMDERSGISIHRKTSLVAIATPHNFQ